jgi:putative ABC transport system permease protein
MVKFLPLVLTALLRKKTRTGFTLISLAMAFLLIGMLQAVNALLAGGTEFLGANRLIVQAKTSFTQPLPMRLMPQIESVPGVERVSHSQFFGGQYQDPKNFFPQFVVNPQRMFDTYPEWRLPADQRRAFITTQDGAIAGKVLAQTYGWKIGDIIPLTSFIWTKSDGTRDWEWRLVGIFDGHNEDWHDRSNLMYLNYGQFDEARLTRANGLAGAFAVRVSDPLRSEEIAAAIDAKFENSSDETKTQSEQEFQLAFLKQVGDIGFIVNAISGAVFFTILILTGYTMSQAVRERIPELAVLKCLGFTDRTVLGVVLAESFTLCLIGAVVGMLCSLLTTFWLRKSGQVPVEFLAYPDGSVWLISGIAAVVLALAVGLPPAWRAMRLKIVDALAGR